MRYKMGFGIANFSYCSWNGHCRRGIVDPKVIRTLAVSSDYR